MLCAAQASPPSRALLNSPIWVARARCRRAWRFSPCVQNNSPEVLDVGRFVGLFCQPTSGFWRFVAVASRSTKSAESPVDKGNPDKNRYAGGGTRTPDTRIMIPLL
jgi:hypothetical protein